MNNRVSMADIICFILFTIRFIFINSSYISHILLFCCSVVLCSVVLLFCCSVVQLTAGFAEIELIKLLVSYQNHVADQLAWIFMIVIKIQIRIYSKDCIKIKAYNILYLHVYTVNCFYFPFLDRKNGVLVYIAHIGIVNCNVTTNILND